MKKDMEVSKGLIAEAEKLAKVITVLCARNTFIEKLHMGVFPESKTGDYSDVKVVTPDREIPWNELSRISQEEMKRLNKQIVNKVFTFLLYLQKEEDPPIGPLLRHVSTKWDPAEIDQILKDILDKARDQENEK